MKFDHCKITEDLMPLYYDNLISKETEEYIEWHLNECKACREKFENLDGEIPDIKDNIVNIEEEDKFISAKKFLLKLRRQMYFAGIFILIILLITSAGSFLFGKRFYNEVPIKVSSAEDFAENVIPGWQRAQRAGQIIDLDIAKPIPGTDAEVTFEKVWYTPSYTYVLYTVREPSKNYLMASQRVIDIPPNEYMRDNSSMEPLSQRWGGISSEGYHQIMVFMGYNTPVPAQELTLTASNWRIPKGSTKPGPIDTIEGKISVQLPLADEFLKESSEMVTLDKSYEWKERSLRLTAMEVRSSKILLYGEAKLLEGETLSQIEGTIRSGEQLTALSYEAIVPGDTPNSFKFAFYSQPLNQWPSKVSLDIRAIKFRSPESLNIPVDWTLYRDREGRIEVFEEQVPAVAFYDGLVRLSSIGPENWIELEIVEPAEKIRKKEPYIIMSLEPPIVDPYNNYVSGLKITNEKGQIIDVGSRGSFRDGDRMGVGFEIHPEDKLWETSKEITITINNPEALLVVNEKLDIQ